MKSKLWWDFWLAGAYLFIVKAIFDILAEEDDDEVSGAR